MPGAGSGNGGRGEGVRGWEGARVGCGAGGRPEFQSSCVLVTVLSPSVEFHLQSSEVKVEKGSFTFFQGGRAKQANEAQKNSLTFSRAQTQVVKKLLQ